MSAKREIRLLGHDGQVDLEQDLRSRSVLISAAPASGGAGGSVERLVDIGEADGGSGLVVELDRGLQAENRDIVLKGGLAA